VAVADPTLEVETEMHRAGARFVIGIDEVGRGAIAGPVAVGLCVVDAAVGVHPAGLRDSKMLSEKRRIELAPLSVEWALYTAVGLASAADAVNLGR
jgi:ribonuclease HII